MLLEAVSIYLECMEIQKLTCNLFIKRSQYVHAYVRKRQRINQPNTYVRLNSELDCMKS